MLNFTGQWIRMWKIPGDRVSQRNSFLYSHWCIFAARQCSLSIRGCVSLVGSSYTGLSWAALCPYLTLADIFSPQCWHKFLPTKQFKRACDKWYPSKRANILCSPGSWKKILWVWPLFWGSLSCFHTLRLYCKSHRTLPLFIWSSWLQETAYSKWKTTFATLLSLVGPNH